MGRDEHQARTEPHSLSSPTPLARPEAGGLCRHHRLRRPNRWGLYTLLGKRLAYARVEHEPWPLHTAAATHLEDDFVAAAGYRRPVDPPHVLYSPGVSVRIERPRYVPALGAP
jgi:uncharacterized protein YqjF (DUF2071 family)